MQETIKEYSEALFIIAKESGKVDVFSDVLSQIRTVLEENSEYVSYLSSPAVALSQRLSAIDEAFSKFGEEDIVNFIKLLCEHRRIGGICECIEEFFALKKQEENRVCAKVVSAVPLSDEQKTALCQKLENKTGKKIDADFVIDASILGGVKVLMDGITLDGSTKKRLSNIKEVMSDE